MSWKQKVRATVAQRTGYELRRVAAPRPRTEHDVPRPPADPEHDRLLRAPVFLLSSVRSGSTLLRLMLDSHPLVHAPHETHVRRLGVEFRTPPVRQAMEACGHRRTDLEHLLWDRVLHRELARSGKRVLVEKTPSNVFVWQRIRKCWPDARFVFLIRHPLSIARSWHEADPENRPFDLAVERTLHYMKALQRARRGLSGPTLRYEDLVADPEAETRRLCAALGVPWDAAMLEYGAHDHGEIAKGIGDWREKITTGRVQPGRPLPSPEEIPELLLPITRTWGYPAS
ncbi:sulfotransferase family protein [Actinocorallia populi]|uniref:sulfotransferase family protein n=1 Tax=Actinocorallia populi TaxID=2079200 RepID=UPI000D08A90D|nr:sulfotransferase [Actinocorallia populi]